MFLRNRNLPEYRNCCFPNALLNNQIADECDEYLFLDRVMIYLFSSLLIHFFAGIQMSAVKVK